MTLNPRQFQQLPMFMTAREIQEQTTPLDKSPGQPRARFWATRARSATHRHVVRNDPDSGNLADSIRTEGVHRPVEISWGETAKKKPELANGHHRVAVSFEHDPDRLIPVVHDAGEGYSWGAAAHFPWRD